MLTKKQKNKSVILQKKETNQPHSQFLYSLIITGIFFTVAGFGILNHEMWRDEHQAWLLARDAHSLLQLFENLKYEGNPALWHLCLYLITYFTSDPFYMQLLHILIACTFIFIFNRYAEFSLPCKILFSFGYFILFEYTVISRSYGLGLLLTFTACMLYKNRSSNYILLGIILGLLANVTIYSLLIALGLTGILLIDYFFYQEKNEAGNLKPIVALIIFGVGTFLSLYQIYPEKNNTFPVFYPENLLDVQRWKLVFSKILTTYLYIPDIQGLHFWNTNVFVEEHTVISPIVPFLFFLVGISIFFRKPLILLLYTGLTIGLIMLFYYTMLTFARYCGHLFIVLIICFWLSKYYPDKGYKNFLIQVISSTGNKIQMPFLLLILFMNFIGGIVTFTKNLQTKFSASKDAADFIIENKLDTLDIIGVTDFVISPLATYLNKKIYYPQRGEFGSFVIWDDKRNNNLTWAGMIDSISSLFLKDESNKLLILDNPLLTNTNGIFFEHGRITKDIKIDFLKSFKDVVVKDEEYYIYLLQKINTANEF